MPPDVQREFEEFLPLQSTQSFVSVFLSQSYGYYIHIILELCSKFHAIDVGLIVSAFHTPGSRGRNLQATRCVLGGNSRVKVVTLFLTPPFRPTPNEAKGVDPINC